MFAVESKGDGTCAAKTRNSPLRRACRPFLMGKPPQFPAFLRDPKIRRATQQRLCPQGKQRRPRTQQRPLPQRGKAASQGTAPSSPQERGFHPFYRLRRRGSAGNRPGMDAGIACAPAANAKGKVGGNDASLPRGARICCRCARSTLFAPAGQKRFRVGAPDFGRVAGESRALGRLACQERSGRRAGRTEACLSALYEATGSTQPSRRGNGGLCPHPLKGPDP